MSLTKPIEQQMLMFLQGILDKEKIDYIIPAERKGTAVMRTLMQEIEEPRLRWDWEKVLSSVAINYASNIDLKGKRILIFDEMVHHGRTLRKVKEEIEKKNPASIVTAGFAVYEKCKSLPDEWYYGSLDVQAYEAIRTDVVEMLQRYGSLLLDTEHLELRVKVKCGLDDFFTALAQASDQGKTYSFSSGADRINLTITNPIILDEASLKSSLPFVASLDGVVQKCRILERPQHGEFSILPIFYPSISGNVDTEWIKRVPAFLNPDILKNATGKQLFYAVGLLSAIEVLRGIIAALGELKRSGKIILEAPKENFSHLAVMFPTLDVDKFQSYILEMIAHPMKLKKHKTTLLQKVESLKEKETIEISENIITSVMSLVDERASDQQLMEDSGMPLGVTCNEIISIAQNEFDVDPGHASTAMDALIDAGILVTRVEKIYSSDNTPWVIRTFMPDGEIVSSRIRRLASVRGRQLKCLT